MDRREALKALTAMAAGSNLTLTPITTRDADGLQLVVLRVSRNDLRHTQLLFESWQTAVAGTALADVRVIVIPHGMELELMRLLPDGRLEKA